MDLIPVLIELRNRSKKVLPSLFLSIIEYGSICIKSDDEKLLIKESIVLIESLLYV
jgi:hypothetical protein